MRVRGPLSAVALGVAVTVLAACVAREEPAAAPAATTQPATAMVTAAATAAGTSTPAATPLAPLTEAGVADLLRRAVCWRDDPARAASCLPPGAETVEAIEAMGRSGDPRFIAPLIDMRWLAVGWRRWVDEALEGITGLRFDEPRDWYEWEATQTLTLPRGYAGWKGRLLSFIDTGFVDFLSDERGYAVRPELLVWAGAGPDEVAPLRAPAFVHRIEERYLRPDDVVYGLVVDGEARAYPRRIIAWHELVSDQFEGTPVVIAFCGPCGGAVAYDPRVGGQRYTFGVSGLVHDARTLLFDEETKSLWDAFTGRPVAGELLDAGLELDRYPLVTTTWADWSVRHPNTRVLDLATGFVRDYSPGAALRGELDSPKPSFPAGEADGRLPAKERVLGVALGGVARAYRVEDVRRRGVVRDSVGGVPLVLLSEGVGAAIRVYGAAGLEVTELTTDGDDLIAIGDDGGDGTRWFVQEGALVSTVDGRRYGALPRQEGYWFAWSRTHPQTTIWGE